MRGGHREGVLWHEPSQCDLLFVTPRKSKALFSPTTRYHDLALGPSLFHWKSQSTTTAVTEPLVCLGFARDESHEGERPMARGSLGGGSSGRSRRRGCR